MQDNNYVSVVGIHVSIRNYETSSLRSMTAYIDVIRPLFTLVLLIPPASSAVHLRASLLLRLTGEFLDCIPGYDPDDFNTLLDFFGEIDRGWLAVLRSQVWDAAASRGVDTTSDQEPISQTERTRLRSVLLCGTDKLEEWLEGMISLAGEPDSEAEARELEHLRQRFDDLFDGTLAEMGELVGSLEEAYVVEHTAMP